MYCLSIKGQAGLIKWVLDIIPQLLHSTFRQRYNFFLKALSIVTILLLLSFKVHRICSDVSFISHIIHLCSLLFSQSGQTLNHVSDAFKESVFISLIFHYWLQFSIHQFIFRFFFSFTYFGFNLLLFSNSLRVKAQILSQNLLFLINIFTACFPVNHCFSTFHKFRKIVVCFFFSFSSKYIYLESSSLTMCYLEVCCLIYMYLRFSSYISVVNFQFNFIVVLEQPWHNLYYFIC